MKGANVATLCVACLGMIIAPGFSFKLTFDAKAAKNRPVSKVVRLLKDMLQDLAEATKQDTELYEELACWCKTNTKEKTKSIADAEAKVTQLTSTIGELSAESAKLNTKIEQLTTEMDGNVQALADAKRMRFEELSKFQEYEKDLLESVRALQGATTVLSKHHSLVQVPRKDVMAVWATIKQQMQKHAGLLEGTAAHSEPNKLPAFAQWEDYLKTDKKVKQEYKPQTGDVFKMLTEMQATFETNLAKAQKEEKANSMAFQELKSAKEEEIAAGKAQIKEKKNELAEVDEELAQSTEDKRDTEASLSADQAFMTSLQTKCGEIDTAYEARKKTRTDEVSAVSQAVATLTDDEAKDTMTRTFNPNPSFVQTGSKRNSAQVDAASKLLTKVAQKVHSSGLADMAVKLRLDAFTEVKQDIDEMITNLLTQKENEITKKDYCHDQLNQNTLNIEAKTRDKTDLVALIADLENQIAGLNKEIATLQEENAEMQRQLKAATENKEKENTAYQNTIADQTTTMSLLLQAKQLLEGFYNAAMVQTNQTASQPTVAVAPDEITGYTKNNAAIGVMSMIQQIIEDTKAMEDETVAEENAAQLAYENFVVATNAALQAKTEAIVNTQTTKATKEGELTTAKSDNDDADTDLGDLAALKAEIHANCDYYFKNFEIRQTARDEEIEALKQAKAILSGSMFTTFLQSA